MTGPERSRSKRGRTRRVRGGTLLLLSVLMIGSAAVRLGVEAAPAINRELAGAPPMGTGHSPETDEVASEGSDHQGKTVHITAAEDLRPMLIAFQEREAVLLRREQQIEDRMKALAIADEAVERKLKALTEIESKLKATLALADGAAEGDLGRLTAMYEKMKPKESAVLFEEMDPSFAAGFLSRMRPETAAGILAGMSPQAAYTVSVVLAGRNATVPRE